MARKFENALVYRVAKSYYLDNLSQIEIAKRENISRSTVSRLLERARDSGVVCIEIKTPSDFALSETEDKLKTKSSFRTLPLIPAVRALLDEQRARQEEYRRLFKKSYCTEYLDYVCTDEMGRLFRPNYITDHFKLLLKQHGLRHIRFHDLRHSCASLLLSQGIPMKQIQEWLGHSTFATTADIYSHLDFNSKLESAQAISDAFAAEPESALAL